MQGSKRLQSEIKTLYRNRLMITAICTAILTASLLWNIYNGNQQVKKLAILSARSNFNKDQGFRLWAANHGGVYVPADERTPPNPYLAHVPERDITIPSGKKLTLMNPAYMLRQMMEEFTHLYGIKGRITSLNPLNPYNTPDDWEKKALQAFEKEVKEIVEFTEIDNEPYIRLISPLITLSACLKCHEQQGYKFGDIRGGISVSFLPEGIVISRSGT